MKKSWAPAGKKWTFQVGTEKGKTIIFQCSFQNLSIAWTRIMRKSRFHSVRIIFYTIYHGLVDLSISYANKYVVPFGKTLKLPRLKCTRTLFDNNFAIRYTFQPPPDNILYLSISNNDNISFIILSTWPNMTRTYLGVSDSRFVGVSREKPSSGSETFSNSKWAN